jgi:hypothetical protein
MPAREGANVGETFITHNGAEPARSRARCSRLRATRAAAMLCVPIFDHTRKVAGVIECVRVYDE